MQYQLKCGKIIHLSIDAYLGLTDQEFHELTHDTHGEEPSHKMFYDKTTKETPPSINKAKEMDYTEDSDETDTKPPIDVNNLPEA